MEQRSKEWFDARRGRITASRVIDILGQKALGQVGETYAQDLAIDIIFPDYDEESFVSADMQRGIDLEPLAFKWFERIMAKDFIEVETCGFFVKDNLGASPDGMVGDNAILEIKCPKPKAFVKVVSQNFVDPKYYAQMQCQMYCTDRQLGYYVNYLAINGEEKGHIIEVKRDEVLIEKMVQRAEECLEIRDRIIREYYGNFHAV